MFSKLFGEHGAKTVITLFHAPSAPSSQRALTLLKQASASASATATEDQASSSGAQNSSQQPVGDFDLEVTEAAPTADQLKSILEFLGPGGVGRVVRDAVSEGDAVERLTKSGGSFVRPLVVDWNGGRAVAGANESEILRLVREASGKRE